MTDQRDDDEERVRRTVHVLLDFVSSSEGIQHTSELPPGWAEQVVDEVVELARVEVAPGEEIINFSVVLRAVVFIVETLLLTVQDRSGDDRLTQINSLRELVDDAY